MSFVVRIPAGSVSPWSRLDRPGKAVLTPGLVDRDGCGVGQVQRAPARQHRNAHLPGDVRISQGGLVQAGGLVVGVLPTGAPVGVWPGRRIRRTLLHVHGGRRPWRPAWQSRLAVGVCAVSRGSAPQGAFDGSRPGKPSGRPSQKHLYLLSRPTFWLVAGSAALDPAGITGAAFPPHGAQFTAQVPQTETEAGRRAALSWQLTKSMRWSWSVARVPDCGR